MAHVAEVIVTMPNKARRESIIKIAFEPNRLEDQNMSAAYELVLPTRQNAQRARQRERCFAKRETETRQLEIVSLAVSQ